MANENLQNALEQAGLTLEGFAEVIQVDPKSVQRWVTGNTIPYPRHRHAICRALNVEEHDLWPDQTPEETAKDSGTEDAGGGEPRSDVVGTWGYADQFTAPDPAAFLTDCDGPVELLLSYWGGQLTPQFAAALAAHADRGQQVQILVYCPSRQLEALIERERVEIRIGEAHGDYWLVKAGGRMLFGIGLEEGVLQPQPLLELNRASEDGLFGRLANHFELLWESDANERLTSHQQLADWLQEIEDDDEEEDDLDKDPGGAAASAEASHVQQPLQAADQGPVGPAGQSGRRRWPRRPD